MTERAPLLKLFKASPFREPEVHLFKEFWQLTSMALQVSVSTFARIALTSIDSAFLGHLGTSALAASSLASIWVSVPLMGVWAGASALITLCGQAWGAQNGELTGIWLQMGLVITSLLSIPVFLWYWCVGSVLSISTNDAEVITLGIRFARILSFSIWPSLVYACVRLYFQSMGIMAPTTVVGTLSIGVATIANYVLIYGCAGWSGMGFDGSPLATVIASWFQPIALISYTILYKKMHLQAWNGWKWTSFTPDRIKTFLNIAGPVASNSLVSNLANSAMTLIAARMGSDIIAANAVISGLWGLLWALFWGFGCATQVRVANHLGANRPIAAKKLGLLGLACTIMCVVCLAILTLSLRHRIFFVYTNDDQLLQLCVLVQPIFIAGFVIESIEILASSILTAMGEVRVTAWTSSLSTWFIELPLAYLGGVVLGYGFPALWYSICIMEMVKLSVYIYTLMHIDWQSMAHRAMEAMEVSGEDEVEMQAEAMTIALSEAGNTPTGFNKALHSPMLTPRLTPSARLRRQGSQTLQMSYISTGSDAMARSHSHSPDGSKARTYSAHA